MGVLKITGYHGTDLKVAKDIVKTEFHCEQNPEHWLGDGIYFYMDESLANWWTTKPTNKFGTKIETPAVIKCEIEIDSNRVFDLRSLDSFKECVNGFNWFWKNKFYNHRYDRVPTFKEIQSLYFNYCFETQSVDMIIAPFRAEMQDYFPRNMISNEFNLMGITYSEVQICLREDVQKDVLKSKSIWK